MSLRLRLTLLFTTLVGGVLLIFGSLVYALVSVVLLDQVDSNLLNTTEQLISQMRVSPTNQFDPESLVGFEPTENVIFQVWGNNNHLLMARPIGLTVPLDELGRSAGQPVFHSTEAAGTYLRVLSVPIKTARGPMGVLQVAIN